MNRRLRLRIWIALLAAVVALGLWDPASRRWVLGFRAETAHYVIESGASREQTEQIGQVMEILYRIYSGFFADTLSLQTNHPKLRIRLYASREAFERHIGPVATVQQEWYDYLREEVLERIRRGRQTRAAITRVEETMPDGK